MIWVLLTTPKAALAQPVEHVIRNDGVACSSHASGTNTFKGLGTYFILFRSAKIQYGTLAELNSQDAAGCRREVSGLLRAGLSAKIRSVTSPFEAARAANMIDAEVQRGPGGQLGNTNALRQDQETIVDNIHNRFSEERPTGTTIDAGLRRLRKAAEAGDSRAQMWLSYDAARAVQIGFPSLQAEADR